SIESEVTSNIDETLKHQRLNLLACTPETAKCGGTTELAKIQGQHHQRESEQLDEDYHDKETHL
ncbi:hypothetical protein J6590_033639, partial [Homalodisca vitripennis]